MTEQISKSSSEYFDMEMSRAYTDRYGNTTVTDSVAGFLAERLLVGYKNPRWKTQVRLGQDATTDLFGIDFEMLVNTKSFAREVVPYLNPAVTPREYATSAYCSPSQPVSASSLSNIPLSEANNAAMSGLSDKIQSKQQQLLAGVMIGELSETLRLLNSRGKTVKDLIARYLLGVNKRPGRALTRKQKIVRASDLWLEASFGWKPFVNDIDDAITYIAKEGTHKKRGTVRSVRSTSSQSTTDRLCSQSFPYLRADSNSIRTGTVRYIACVDVGSNSDHRARSLGLAPQGWLPTAWELVPWSFLVDYFSNIGSIVNAFSIQASSVRWVVKTTRQVEKQVVRMRPAEPFTSTGFLTENKSGKCICEFRRINRSSADLFTPSLALEIPGLSTKWVNMAALAISVSNSNTSYWR